MKNKNLINKGICLGIYAGALALGKSKKKWKPLAAVVGLHAVEYIAVGRKIGKAAGKSEAESAVNSLLFGITWWKPLKEELEAQQKQATAVTELVKEGLIVEDKFADKGCGVRFVSDTAVATATE